MPHRTKSLALASLAAAGLAIAGCGDDDSDGGDQQTLNFTAPSIDVVFTDLGKKGADPGDLRAFTQDLYEDGSDQSVGRLDGTVMLTDVDKLSGKQVEYRAGEVQFTLDGGTIVAVGNYIAEPGQAAPIDGGSTRAIVGGTGDYDGASGEVTSTPGGGDQVDYELRFDLPDD
jgi:hypothetical protein